MLCHSLRMLAAKHTRARPARGYGQTKHAQAEREAHQLLRCPGDFDVLALLALCQLRSLQIALTHKCNPVLNAVAPLLRHSGQVAAGHELVHRGAACKAGGISSALHMAKERIAISSMKQSMLSSTTSQGMRCQHMLFRPGLKLRERMVVQS